MANQKETYRKLMYVILLVSFIGTSGCSLLGDEEKQQNVAIPHANGIYMPEQCTESPTAIQLVGHLDLPNPLTDIWGYYDEENGREYALAGFHIEGDEPGGGLYIINVTNPGNPELASIIMDANEVKDVKLWKEYVYTVTGSFTNTGGGYGRIYDLSDPEKPERVGKFESGHNIFIKSDGYLYKSAPNVKRFNLVPDPKTPELDWEYPKASSHDIAVIGDTLFDFHGFDGTLLYDLSGEGEPEIIKGLDNNTVRYHHSGWISRDREYLYINDELPANLYKNIDISIWNIEKGTMVGSYRDTTSTVHNSFELCNRLVVSYYVNGLALFDVSDPTQLTLLDQYDTDPDEEGPGNFLGAWGVFPYTKSGNILVSDVNKGLYVFRLN